MSSLFRSSVVLGALVVGLANAPRPAHAQPARGCAEAFDLAQQARDEGRYRHARMQFVACAQDRCPREIAADCVAGLSELDKLAPTVVVGARDARGRDLVTVRVSIDGVAVLERLDGLPTMVDPGPHTFRYEVPGERAQEEQVVIRAGEKNRVLSVTFDGTSPQAATSAGVPVATWVLGGVSVAALASWGIFGAMAVSDYRDCDARFATPSACTDRELDGVVRSSVVADVSLVAGVVTAGLAAYFFFTRPHGTAPPTQLGLRF